MKNLLLLLLLIPAMSYQQSQSVDAMLYGSGIHMVSGEEFVVDENKGLVVVTDTSVAFYGIDLKGDPYFKYSYKALERNKNNIITFDTKTNKHHIILLTRGFDEVVNRVITRIEDICDNGKSRVIYEEDTYQSVLLDGYLRAGGFLPELEPPKIPEFELTRYRKQYKL